MHCNNEHIKRDLKFLKNLMFVAKLFRVIYFIMIKAFISYRTPNKQ